MRYIIGLAVLLGLIVTTGAGTRVTAQGPNPAFNFDTGNSGIEVIIPTVIPALFQTTSPNDAPIVLRLTTVITNAWFDAIAPYHPTAVGVYSRLGRRLLVPPLTLTCGPRFPGVGREDARPAVSRRSLPAGARLVQARRVRGLAAVGRLSARRHVVLRDEDVHAHGPGSAAGASIFPHAM